MTERTLPAHDIRTEEPRHGPRRPGLVLAIIVTCYMMLILDLTVMNVALPAIQADLHLSATNLAWVVNAYALSYGGLLLLGGRAGDIYGRRHVFVSGVVLFTVASLFGGMATSAAWLLLARVVQGAGAAMAGPSALALLTTTFTDPRERVRALSIYTAVASGGLAMGLLVGGALTASVSWRWVLFINVPFGLAVAVLAPRYIRQPERHEGRLDLPGAVTATTGAAALVYGFIRAASEGWGDGVTLGAFATALVVLALFLAVETRTAQPLMPLHLFADRNRAGAYLNMLLLPAGMLAVFFFLTQFLQDVRGYSALRTGFAFLPLALVLFAVARLIPRLLPRFGPQRLVVTGTALIAAGIAWLAQLTPTSGYAASLLGPMLLFGLGAGLAVSPLNVVIMSAVPARESGAASGILQTMQQVGGSLGLAILVTVFGTAARHAARHPLADGVPPAHHVLTDGITTAFTGGTLFAVCAFLVALNLRRAHA